MLKVSLSQKICKNEGPWVDAVTGIVNTTVVEATLLPRTTQRQTTAPRHGGSGDVSRKYWGMGWACRHKARQVLKKAPLGGSEGHWKSGTSC